jgi:gluconokinase
LNDNDRKKWLRTLRKLIVGALKEKKLSALSCSALKAKYRKSLAAGDPRVQFVHLTGPPELIEARLKSRRGHFMPPALLESQLAILEPPTEALVYSCKIPPKKIVAGLVQLLGIPVAD